MPADEVKPTGSTSPVAREKLEAQIKSADMTDDMQQEAVEVAQEAMAKFTIEKDIAQQIKKTFDERKGPTWHCIVGRNFGSFVTHETKHFIYFYLGHCAILLFKTHESTLKRKRAEDCPAAGNLGWPNEATTVEQKKPRTSTTTEGTPGLTDGEEEEDCFMTDRAV